MMAESDTVGNTVIQMGGFEPETIATLFTRVDMSWPEDSRARFVVARPGDLALVRSVHSTTKSSSRRLERHMTDADSQYHFACLPLEGHVHIKHLGRDCELGRGTLGIIKTSEEYVIEMSDYLDAIWLRIPTKIMNSHAVSTDQALARPLDAARGLGYSAQQLMCGVLTEGNEFTPRGARLFAQSLVGFIGELVNSTLHDGASASSQRRHKILARARDFIEEHLSDDELSPQFIAQGMGISARYLSDIFAAEGTSPMRWVQQRRLERCRMEIEKRGAGQQLICEIAYSMGFANVSSFNRAFKAHYGRSPSDLMAARAPSQMATALN